jgi:hypothetical protein
MLVCRVRDLGQTAVRPSDQLRAKQEELRVKASWWVKPGQTQRRSGPPELVLLWRTAKLEEEPMRETEQPDFLLPFAYAWDRSTATNYRCDDQDPGMLQIPLYFPSQHAGLLSVSILYTTSHTHTAF